MTSSSTDLKVLHGLGIQDAVGVKEALWSISRERDSLSLKMSALMIYMSERHGVSLYEMSKLSGVSASAVKGRVSGEEGRAALNEVLYEKGGARLAVVDLDSISDEAREEVLRAREDRQ